MIMAATFLGSSHFIYFFIYFLGLLDKGHIKVYSKASLIFIALANCYQLTCYTNIEIL